MLSRARPHRASLRGVVYAWLLGAALLGVLTLGGMVRQRNLAFKASNERLARDRLESMVGPVRESIMQGQQGQAAASASTGSVRGATPRLRELLRAEVARRDVSQAVLLRSDAVGSSLPFLRDVRVVASGDSSLPPGPIRGKGRAASLSPARAKELYDWSGRVMELRSRTDLRWIARPGAPERIEVGRRISLSRGEFILGLRLLPVARPVAVPVWLLLLLLLGGLALPLGSRLVTGAWRWLASAAGMALMAGACGVLLAGYGSWAARAPATTGALGLLSAGLRAGVPSGGLGYLWALCSLVALAIPLLGWRGTGHRAARGLVEHRVAAAYVLPAGLGMLVLVLVPFVVGIGLGFFNHCEGHFEYVGLANFTDILSGGGTSISDPLNFWFTLGVTLLWTSLNVLLHLSIGLALALLLKDPLLRGKGVYRVLLILPWAVPNYITALMWKGMFHQQFGAVNQLLGLLGMEKVSWFSHFWTSFTANVVTNTWLGFPFMMVVTLGALQSIPKDLYEAAEVDGASRWYQLTRITLPLLKPALLPAVILGSIWTFNMFNVIYLVSSGEPAGSTDILITEAYRWAFIRHERYGLAAAYATLIFLILLGYSLLTNRVAKGAEETFK